MTSKTLHVSLSVLSLLNIGISFWGWSIDATSSVPAAIGGLSVPIIWIVVSRILKKRPLSEQSHDEKRFLFFNIFIAATIIIIAQMIKLFGSYLSITGTDASLLIERSWGVAVGALLFIIGNMIPKTLPPFASQRSNSSEYRALRRFAGKVFLCAGLGYMAAWTFLPISVSNLAATLCCALGVGLVAMKVFFFRQQSKKET